MALLDRPSGCRYRVGRGAAVLRLVLGLLGAFVPAVAARAQEPDDAFLAAVRALPAASLSERGAIVDRVAESGHASARPVLAALLEERLFVRERDGAVFVVTPADESLASLELLDPASQKSAGQGRREELAKIGTNNQLRRRLKIALARFDLASPDAAARLGAVQEMLRALDEASVAVLRQRVGLERDAAVKAEIETGLALAALDGTDGPARLQAITVLARKLRPDVRNRLASLLERGPDGRPAEGDAQVRAAAAAAVRSIDLRRNLYAAVEALFFGVSLGSVLVLVAIGLAITFGVMGVINMAHGELVMLGAYTTYVVQQLLPDHLAASILLAVPAAFLVVGLAGVALERTVIRFLYGRPLDTLLATFGVSLVLQQLVRTTFSANNRAVKTPDFMSGSWQVNEALALTYNRLTIVLFTLLVFGVLVVVLKRTRLGLQIRAVAQNRAMARAMGVRSEWVDALTFGLGSGIAGMAGVALSQLTNVGPNLGQSYIIDSFMVVVFGGVGNLWGTLIGGMGLGIVNKLLEPYAGAVLGKILVLVALILFIQRRPRGLFPPLGRAADGQ
jgi:urea transport system permease protein